MRDYILSLTLLSIFLGAYTALVIGYAKPLDSSRGRSAHATESPTSPREPSATQTIAEPSED